MKWYIPLGKLWNYEFFKIRLTPIKQEFQKSQKIRPRSLISYYFEEMMYFWFFAENEKYLWAEDSKIQENIKEWQMCIIIFYKGIAYFSEILISWNLVIYFGSLIFSYSNNSNFCDINQYCRDIVCNNRKKNLTTFFSIRFWS